MHCNVTPDVTFEGVYSTTFDPGLRNEVKFFFNLVGVHSTTFHLEPRNERFTLISFMGFPTVLSTLQPFQIYIFNRKKSKLTFSNGPQVMEKKVYGKFACIIGQYMEK